MLINCVAYQEGNKLADIHPGEIGDYVNRPECFVWVALFEPSNEEHIFATSTTILCVSTVGLMVAIDVYLFYRFRKAKWL